MPNLFGRPLWSYLPVGTIFYSNENDTDPNSLKIISHMAYAMVGIIYVAAYPILLMETGSFNPISQIKIKSEQSRRYKELNNKIFGPGGFADTNFDKNVDINEKANAYKKLRLTDFPKEKLKLEQLEELVKKYMN